jgi:long-subunit fatty acid transport protein
MRIKIKVKKRARRTWRQLHAYSQTLEYQLTEALSGRAGERGFDEGAVDTLYRIIHERDQALLILGLDRLRNFREGRL